MRGVVGTVDVISGLSQLLTGGIMLGENERRTRPHAWGKWFIVGEVEFEDSEYGFTDSVVQESIRAKGGTAVVDVVLTVKGSVAHNVVVKQRAGAASKLDACGLGVDHHTWQGTE
jgi:hypothetical protein